MSIEFDSAFDSNSIRSMGVSPMSAGRHGRDAQATKKPPSARRLAANRANARKSTGPRTAKGKRRVGRNAMKHGLCAMYGVRLPSECGATFNTFLFELEEELQ